MGMTQNPAQTDVVVSRRRRLYTPIRFYGLRGGRSLDMNECLVWKDLLSRE